MRVRFVQLGLGLGLVILLGLGLGLGLGRALVLQDTWAEQHVERPLRHAVVQPARDRGLPVVACIG